MHIISLGTNESAVIDNNIIVKVLEICDGEVWLEIERPGDVWVERGEVCAAVRQAADWTGSSATPGAALLN